MVRKIDQKWGIIQIRTLAKNGDIIQNLGKCSENKINSKCGILRRMWRISIWGIPDFKIGDFECSP